MSTSKTRIYIVSPKGDDTRPVSDYRMIRASNATQALRHVAQDTLDTIVAGQEALIFLSGQGVKVEDAIVPDTQLDLNMPADVVTELSRPAQLVHP